MANTAISATIKTTSSPIVTKIIAGKQAVDSLNGTSITYPVTNGHVLAYNSSANTFTPVSVASARGSIDGGEVT